MKRGTLGHHHPRQPSSQRRTDALTAAAAGIALLCAACGASGGSPAAGSASGPAASPASQQAAAASSIPPTRQAQLTSLAQQYTACMRSHGITSFPDPAPGGGFGFHLGGINTRSPRYQTAAQACHTIASKARQLAPQNG